MQRLIGAAAVALALFAGPADAAHAKRHHHSARHGDCGGLAPVRSVTGAVACVAHVARARLQALVSALDAEGYRIDFMGGWRRRGSCPRCNMHPRGLAIDINQTGRNRVTRPLPANATDLARRLGVVHGAVWRRPDAGHFELARR